MGEHMGTSINVLNLAKDALDEGIGISGLGIGNEWNDKFLDQLAGISGGISMYISAPKDLRKFLEQKYRNLEQVYGEQVSLNLAENTSKYCSICFPNLSRTSAINS